MDGGLSELIEKLAEISRRGYVQTHRSGNTGIGKTLEDLLDIEENNKQGADWRGFELKAHRKGGQSRITLITMSPKLKNGRSWREFIEEFGYVDRKGRLAIKKTLYPYENDGWRIDATDREILLINSGEVVATWDIDDLNSRLYNKLHNTVFVFADTIGSGSREEFHYNSIRVGESLVISDFVDLIMSGDIVIEMRMHQKESGAVRDHGTAFRIKEDKIKNIFDSTNSIDLG